MNTGVPGQEQVLAGGGGRGRVPRPISLCCLLGPVGSADRGRNTGVNPASFTFLTHPFSPPLLSDESQSASPRPVQVVLDALPSSQTLFVHFLLTLPRRFTTRQCTTSKCRQGQSRAQVSVTKADRQRDRQTDTEKNCFFVDWSIPPFPTSPGHPFTHSCVQMHRLYKIKRAADATSIRK